jgi:hypothetical protein
MKRQIIMDEHNNMKIQQEREMKNIRKTKNKIIQKNSLNSQNNPFKRHLAQQKHPNSGN